MLYSFEVLLPQPRRGTIVFNAPVFIRQTIEGKPELQRLRAEFRGQIVADVHGIIPEAQLHEALDVTRLFAGFAFT